MTKKTYIPDEENAPESQIGATLEALYQTIEARKSATNSESYTKELLSGSLDTLCKKVSEETLETCLAAKETDMTPVCSCDASAYEASLDHLRYEAGDVIYHLLVLLSRFDIPIDELAAELNSRMLEDERAEGAILLHEDHIRRGK